MKRCSNKECCKQCRYFKFKGTMTKWPVQKLTHRTTQNTYNIMTQQTFRKTIFLCFSELAASVSGVMNVNVTGTILLNTAILQCCDDAGQGEMVIINVSSLAAVRPFPSWSLYCTSKLAR